jgi:hypothetical protein
MIHELSHEFIFSSWKVPYCTFSSYVKNSPIFNEVVEEEEPEDWLDTSMGTKVVSHSTVNAGERHNRGDRGKRSTGTGPDGVRGMEVEVEVDSLLLWQESHT